MVTLAKKTTLDPGDPSTHFNGDRRLCYALRGGGIRAFLTMLEETARQLLLVDQAANHDEILPAEILEAASDWHFDHTHSALTGAQHEMNHALNHTQAALANVAGLFKGSLKDETEEMLLRLVRLMQSRSDQLSAVVQSYELPKRPHEIRRNSLSYLIAECLKLANAFSHILTEECPDASPDLLAELNLCQQEIAKEHAGLQQLRERSSQKMGEQMIECLKRMVSIHLRTDAVELQARTRGSCQILRDPRLLEWSHERVARTFGTRHIDSRQTA